MQNVRAVIIVGAGGIGSALFQDLCRFLPHTWDIHLIDGDVVEGKNIQRQHFSRKDLGRNKAQALAEKASVAIGLDRVYFHPAYLTRADQLQRITQYYQKVILVGAVDNHPARRVQEAFVRQSSTRIYYIDCANEETRGEVVAVVGGKDGVSGLFRSQLDPRVLTDDQGDPTQASCTQQLDQGSLQTLFTNRKAAVLALELVAAYMRREKEIEQGEVTPPTGIAFFRECVVKRWT